MNIVQRLIFGEPLLEREHARMSPSTFQPSKTSSGNAGLVLPGLGAAAPTGRFPVKDSDTEAQTRILPKRAFEQPKLVREATALVSDVSAARLESRRLADRRASERLKALICAQTSRACEEHFGKTLRSVLLTGSLARDEGTFVQEKRERWTCLGDAEFLLIFKRGAPVPSQAVLAMFQREIEGLLEGHGLICRTRISALHPADLRKLGPRIYTFELRNCGQAIWGDAGALALIPDFSPSEIPLEDGWRLLCERIVEQLSVADQLLEWRPTLSAEAHYQTVKLYLDMATSFLLFSGVYAATCRERSKRLAMLARNARAVAEYPFALRDFSSQVEACTQWKLSSGEAVESETRNFWETAVVYAWLLWRWELARLTGADPRLGEFRLLRRWFRLQPLGERWREWAHALKQSRGYRNWRQWPRWARLGLRASPRFWIYAAASDLFFSLPWFPNGYGGPMIDVNWAKVREWLPFSRNDAGAKAMPEWHRLASDIVWNYQQIFQDTSGREIGIEAGRSKVISFQTVGNYRISEEQRLRVES